ncbi:hypothetical protein H4696_003435 [Amycolatopsis lexingtonensis]|uniref:Uncharacterized protein n=1 Tax=Amycolatopsis lexingtonensis TaxID=218822 RepID=A0ABR9HZH2_9PSEU|nr:hypothetical protein [Amycolatopsis lexingtonensis]
MDERVGAQAAAVELAWVDGGAVEQDQQLAGGFGR